MEYFLKGLREYANFSGRARRNEYWLFALMYCIIYVAIILVGKFLGGMWLSTIFSLVMFIPSISYGARRLHDTGRSGWWQLLYLIPLIGFIILVIFLIQDSHREENAYGISPKYQSADA